MEKLQEEFVVLKKDYMAKENRQKLIHQKQIDIINTQLITMKTELIFE